MEDNVEKFMSSKLQGDVRRHLKLKYRNKPRSRHFGKFGRNYNVTKYKSGRYYDPRCSGMFAHSHLCAKTAILDYFDHNHMRL
mmetsp:Transcript_21641/g.24496  ORF Transcript_21641/g.24496 Transcript_21641/m.24496 type:complete len:83 (+) Transcript_21641:57-305(+)